MKTLRSLLYTPANRPKMLDKAASYGADAVIFDLEDSVPIPQKPEARLICREYLDRFNDTCVMFVRVNALETGLLSDDLEAVVGESLEGICLPKVDDPATVRAVDAMLTEIEKARGLPAGKVEIVVSLESARGVYLAYEILSAAQRVGSVSIGTAEDGDLQTDLGYVWSVEGEEVLYVRSKVLLAARAAGIANPLDGAYPNFRDEAGLIAASQAARKLGYRGKKLIHPNQIEPVNRIFTPAPKEIDYYRRLLDAFDGALAQGLASTTFEGKMIDYAMAANARRVLSWAESLAAR